MWFHKLSVGEFVHSITDKDCYKANLWDQLNALPSCVPTNKAISSGHA